MQQNQDQFLVANNELPTSQPGPRISKVEFKAGKRIEVPPTAQQKTTQAVSRATAPTVTRAKTVAAVDARSNVRTNNPYQNRADFVGARSAANMAADLAVHHTSTMVRDVRDDATKMIVARVNDRQETVYSTAYFAAVRDAATVAAICARLGLPPLPGSTEPGEPGFFSPNRLLATHEGAAKLAAATIKRFGKGKHARMVAHLLRVGGVGLEDICGGFLRLDIHPVAENDRDMRPVYPCGHRRGTASRLAGCFVGQLPRAYTAWIIASVIEWLTGVKPVRVQLTNSSPEKRAKNNMGGAFVDFDAQSLPGATAFEAAAYVAAFSHCAVLGDLGAFLGGIADGPRIRAWVERRDKDLEANRGLCKSRGELGVGALSIELSKKTKQDNAHLMHA